METFLGGLGLAAISGLVFLAYNHRVEYAAFLELLIPLLMAVGGLTTAAAIGAMAQIRRSSRRVEDKREIHALKDDLDKASKASLVVIATVLVLIAFLQFLTYLPKNPAV